LQENKIDVEDEKLDRLFPGTPALKNAEDHPEPVLFSEFADDVGDDSEEKKPPVPQGLPKERSGPLISRADFNRIVRIFYKVVKEIVLSDSLLIESSGQIRKMDVGEVVEVSQGPILDPSVGVYRIRGRALKDGASGYVTVAGNQGITFLQPGGNVFRVVKSTNLSKELKDEKDNTERILKEGEVLEVLEWARTSGSAIGVTRIKGKAQNDGAIGWATILSSEGQVFLEAA